MGNPADLINSAIEELVRQRIELPGFTTLDDLSQLIRTQVNENWYQQIMQRLTPDEIEKLRTLPQRRDENSATNFTILKTPPRKPNLSEMKRIKDRLHWLIQQLDTKRVLVNIPTARIMRFAAEARSLEAGDLSRYSTPHQFTLLVCFLHQVTIETRDHLIEIFLKRMRLIHQRAQQDLDAIRERQKSLTESLIRLLGEIAGQVEQNAEPSAIGTAVLTQMDGVKGAAEIRRTCEALIVYHDNNILPLLQPHYTPYRRTLFEIMDLLTIRSTTQDETLVKALNFIKQHQMEKSSLLPAELMLDFASQRWQNQVTHRQDEQV